MTRFHVHVVQMRARDVRRGDVVARDPGRQDGWFRVHQVVSLPDGLINVLDKTNARSFTAGPFDLIGLQTPVALPPEADGSAARPATARAAADPAPAAPDPSSVGAEEREEIARQIRSQSGDVGGSLPPQ